MRLLKIQNFFLKKGKKELSHKVIKQILITLRKKKSNKIKMSILIEKALMHTQPLLNIKRTTKGKRTFIKPYILKPLKNEKYTNKLIIHSSQLRHEKTILNKVACELLEASEGKGLGVKKVKELYELVLSHKAYMKYF